MPVRFSVARRIAASLALAWTVETAALAEPSGGRADALSVDEIVRLASDFRARNEHAILREFIDLLAIPNYGRDQENIRRNAHHIVAMLEARGASARILDVDGGSPAVYGELDVPGATRTITLYVHYDGQPASVENWATPPYRAVLRDGPLENDGQIIDPAEVTGAFDPDWRLYARATSDDKAPIIGLLYALDALKEKGISPSFNVRFFFEGEEEIGSPNLKRILQANRQLLKSDLWLFCDGPVDPSGRNRLIFGSRGVTEFTVTVYGSARGLHSGHYGNYAPNPIVMLSHLITSMRDENARIHIDGFHDNVLPPTADELVTVRRWASSHAQVRQDLAIARSEAPDQLLEEAVLSPALNLLGIQSGTVGLTARNVINPTATATIGLRIVPNQSMDRLRGVVEDHIRAQGYHIVRQDPDGDLRTRHPRIAKVEWSKSAYGSVRTPLALPESQALIRLTEQAMGHPPVIIVGSGASLPLAPVRDVLGAPLVILPIANHDNNQHAPNENIRLGNLWRGIELYAAILAKLGDEIDD